MPRRVRSCLLAPNLEPLEARMLLAVDPAAAPPPLHVAEPGRYVAGVVATDLNRDGAPDLVIASGSRLLVHINRGDGTFQPEGTITLRDGLPRKVGRPYPDRIFAGDFNGDLEMDIAVTGSTRGPGGHYHPRTWLFIGEGDGRLDAFIAVGRFNLATQSLNGQLIIADVNGDGADDLITTGMRFAAFDGRYLKDRGPVVGLGWSFHPSARPVAGDVDGDGDLDIVGTLSEGDAPVVLVRSGDFGPAIEPINGIDRAGEFQFHDLTGDGLPELVRSRWRVIDGAQTLVLEAVPNIAGTFAGPAETIYQETREQIRARGGHLPSVPSDAEHFAGLSIADVRDLDADDRLDLVVTLESRQTEIGHANPEQFDEVYTFGLIASESIDGRELPLYTANNLPVDVAAPPGTRDVLATADFDQDESLDSVLGRSYTLFPGDDYGGVRAIYVDLAADARPVALVGGIHGDGPGRGLEAGGLLSVNVRFRKAEESASALVEVELFLDMNGDDRLDVGDLRIGRDRTARGNLYEFRLRRSAEWDRAGLGYVALFMVARDDSGVLSVPQSGRVRMI